MKQFTLVILVVAFFATVNLFGQDSKPIKLKAKTAWESQGTMPDAFGFIDPNAECAFYLVGIANKGRHTGIASFRSENTVGHAFGLAWGYNLIKTEKFQLNSKFQGTYFSEKEKLSWIKGNVGATWENTTVKSSWRRNDNDFTIWEAGAQQKVSLWKSAALTPGYFYRSVNDKGFHVPFINLEQKWHNIAIALVGQYQHNLTTEKGDFLSMIKVSFNLMK